MSVTGQIGSHRDTGQIDANDAQRKCARLRFTQGRPGSLPEEGFGNDQEGVEEEEERRLAA